MSVSAELCALCCVYWFVFDDEDICCCMIAKIWPSIMDA
jgi:hypothetical protein